MTLKLLPIFAVFLILYQKHFVNADPQIPIAQEVASLKNELLWCLKHESAMIQGTTSESKVDKILKGSLDLIPSPSPSVKIQIIGGKVYLR